MADSQQDSAVVGESTPHENGELRSKRAEKKMKISCAPNESVPG
jgi:hypothetical protein